MKHKLKFFPIVFLFAILFFASCNSASFEKKAETKAEEFFEAYNNQDFDKIVSISYEKNSIFKKIMEETIKEEYGKIESFTKYKSFKPTEYNNKGITFFYKCKFKKKKENIYCTISILEGENESVVVDIAFDADKDWIDNKHIYYAQSSLTAIEYYVCLRNNPIEDISKFLDQKTIIDAGFEADFINMLQEKRKYYGKIIKTTELQKGAFKRDDGTHAIKIFSECKTDSVTFYERIDIVKSENGFKIIDLHASIDLDNL